MNRRQFDGIDLCIIGATGFAVGKWGAVGALGVATVLALTIALFKASTRRPQL